MAMQFDDFDAFNDNAPAPVAPEQAVSALMRLQYLIDNTPAII